MIFNSPEDVLKTWMAFVNQGDIEGLVSLYDENAILIPTFSNRQLDAPEKLRKYFENLVHREDLSIALHEKTLAVQAIRNGLYSMCGIYCWRFAVDGELLNFEARFSYILDLALPNPIIHHHTSQIPRTL
jgi:hypothetical protein